MKYDDKKFKKFVARALEDLLSLKSTQEYFEDLETYSKENEIFEVITTKTPKTPGLHGSGFNNISIDDLKNKEEDLPGYARAERDLIKKYSALNMIRHMERIFCETQSLRPIPGGSPYCPTKGKPSPLYRSHNRKKQEIKLITTRKTFRKPLYNRR